MGTNIQKQAEITDNLEANAKAAAASLGFVPVTLADHTAKAVADSATTSTEAAKEGIKESAKYITRKFGSTAGLVCFYPRAQKNLFLQVGGANYDRWITLRECTKIQMYGRDRFGGDRLVGRDAIHTGLQCLFSVRAWLDAWKLSHDVREAPLFILV